MKDNELLNGGEIVKWTAKEVSTFIEQKQYIDTVLIPLLPISFGVSVKESANSTEFIQLLVSRLEHQFKGRILLLPGVPYTQDSSLDEKEQLIQSWKGFIEKQENFKHIIFLSTDTNWKTISDLKDDSFLWIPSVPLEHLEEKYRQSIIDDQVKQLLNFFIQKWQKFD